jgi:hypothetical protein
VSGILNVMGSLVILGKTYRMSFETRYILMLSKIFILINETFKISVNVLGGSHRNFRNLARKFVSETPIDYFILWTYIRFRKILYFKMTNKNPTII